MLSHQLMDITLHMFLNLLMDVTMHR